MKLMIEIALDSAAFGDSDYFRDIETARILHGLANRIGDEGTGIEGVNCSLLFDFNGNSVGEAYLVDSGAEK
jgi:hypothetical protein